MPDAPLQVDLGAVEPQWPIDLEGLRSRFAAGGVAHRGLDAELARRAELPRAHTVLEPRHHRVERDDERLETDVVDQRPENV